MSIDNKEVETFREELKYGIEIRTDVAMRQNQAGLGNGTFEVLIDDKTRYRINYSFEDSAALEDYQKTISEAMEEISLIVKLTLGIVGH